ncbi:MAG: hypothetical protein GC129_04150 [Proteobacteria bacterium]|nr:hypothetical protein [Pseudomonadota bacterium]
MPAARALNLKHAQVFQLVVIITALLSWVIALGAASTSILQNLYANWQLGRSNSITLYLPPDADAATVHQLQQSLPTLAGVTGVAPVSPHQLQEWLTAVVPNPETLPLPTVLEVNLAPTAARPQILAHIQQTFPTAEIDDHQPLLAQVQGAVRSLQSGALLLAGVMLTLMVLLVALTVRTGLAAQKPVLHLLITLGADDALLSRLVTSQVSRRVLTGTAIGTATAVAVTGAVALLNPTLASCLGANTWSTLVLTPLLLPIVAAITAHLTTSRLLRRLA